MRCADCKWKYPDSFLNKMYVNGAYTDPICGICALEKSNRASGMKRNKFQGEIAEGARISAVEWRRTHPTDAPTMN
jgi:hypothetical protein